MNAKGKKQISEWVNTLTGIKSSMEGMQSEEQDKFDNLPDGIQDSERGEAMQEAADQLEYAAENISDAIDNLQEIQG